MATMRKRKAGADSGAAREADRSQGKVTASSGAATPKKPKRPRRQAAVLASDSEALFVPPPEASAVEPRRDATLEVATADVVSEVVVALVPVHRPPPPPPRRSRPLTVLLSVVGLAAVVVVAFAIRSHRSHEVTVGDAQRSEAAASPATAVAVPVVPAFEIERGLGHAAFLAGRRDEALRHYDRALRLDRQALDAQMTANLIACYGSRHAQPVAATLIVRHQLRDAEPALEQLRKTGATRGTRSGALYTLEKLGRGARRPG